MNMKDLINVLILVVIKILDISHHLMFMLKGTMQLSKNMFVNNAIYL